MKDFWNNLKRWQKVSIIGSVLIVLAIIITSVIMIINSEPKVKINFGDGVNIPGDERMKIRKKMVGVIHDNTDNFNENAVYTGNARDYNELSEGGTTTAAFVVDFDEIKESYSVIVTWPDPDNGVPNIIISCPLLDSKYPETACSTESNSSKDIVSFLPYEGTDSAGKQYKITVGYFANEPYLEIMTDGNAPDAIEAAKKWMTLFNFNPDDHLFYIQSGDYIQANHARTNDANVNENLPYFIPAAYYVYPVVDGDNNVVSLNAEIVSCTEYQANMAEEGIEFYLNSKGIKYPINFDYCVE